MHLHRRTHIDTKAVLKGDSRSVLIKKIALKLRKKRARKNKKKWGKKIKIERKCERWN